MSSSYEKVRAQLSELNYLYPLSEDTVPLVQALLSDLISAVSSYKELESEHEITAEELRLAVEEINRVGVIEIPKLIREKNELHIQLIKSREQYDSGLAAARKEAIDADERAMKLELIVSQLKHENKELNSENSLLRTRVDQLLLVPPSDSAIFTPSHHDLEAELTDDGPWSVVNAVIPDIRELESQKFELELVVKQLTEKLMIVQNQYSYLESKYLEISPVTLSGNWVGLGGGQEETIRELNERLDFLNEKYRELKSVHDRCGVVTDSPLVDLRESRKELNLVASRYDKVKLEVERLRTENTQLRQKQVGVKKPPTVVTTACERCNELFAGPNGDVITTLKEEGKRSRKEIESLRRQLKEAQNETKVREKELRAFKNTTGIAGDKAENRKMAGEIALLEEKLKQVTEDRDELIYKLDEIDRAIEGMESEIIRIEKENIELRREKIAKEEAFVGISKQLQEVNGILKSLTEDMAGGEECERLRFRVNQLEKELKFKEEEIGKLRSTVELVRTTQPAVDLEALVKSLTLSKDQAISQLRSVQAELNEKRVQLERASKSTGLEAEVEGLKKTVRKLDHERDELQRVCDDQIEKIEFYKNENAALNMKLSQVSDLRLETDRLRSVLEEREVQLSKLRQVSLDLDRKDIQIRSLQTELSVAHKEIIELTKDNQTLSQELVRLQANHVAQSQVESLMESLRLTEKERNDILSLYRQIVDETKVIASEKSKFEDILRLRESENQELIVRCREATLSNQDLIARCREAELVIASQQSKNVFPQQDAAVLNELEKTIEQQYILIGEMDAEQSRLLVEIDQLRDQLQHR